MVMVGGGLSSPNNNVRDFQNPLWSGTTIPAPYSGSFFPTVSRIPIRDKVLTSGFSKLLLLGQLSTKVRAKQIMGV